MKSKKTTTTANKYSFAILFWLAFVLSLSFIFWPDLKLKSQYQKSDKNISFLMDWVDIKAESEHSDRPINSVLSDLENIPVHVLSVGANLSLRNEQRIRSKGISILWRQENDSNDFNLRLLDRIKPGDGLLSYGDVAYGYPRFLSRVIKTIIFLRGYYPLVEFASQKGGSYVARKIHPLLVKVHCLQAKEGIVDKKYLWKPRLIRAVNDRWVRMLYIQLGSGLSFNQWTKFLTEVRTELVSQGYSMESPKPFSVWSSKLSVPAKNRLHLIFVIALLAPLVSVLAYRTHKIRSPLITFLLMSLVIVISGVSIHAIGSTPETVLGLHKIRGTKLLLLLPLIFSFGFLLRKQEWQSLLKTKLTVFHVSMMGLFLIGFVGVYLMRSGNFPLLPVMDGERVFRDFLDQIFTVRPRFKEFLIGHPLILLGLYIQSQSAGKNNHFFTDGRLWLCLGIVGQISIINTFLHFHSPFDQSILRTLHGLWLGFLISIPLCFLWTKKWGNQEK